jgi:acylphosphatase
LRRRAQEAGVGGWARNCPDGTVEAVLEGALDAVERVLRLAEAGPRQAQVERVEVSEEEPEGLTRFEVR